MIDFVQEKNNIADILMRAGQKDVARKFNNIMLMGGTEGERFSILVSLTKVYEISNPKIFNLIREQAMKLYKLSEQLNYDIRANFDLLDNLDFDLSKE